MVVALRPEAGQAGVVGHTEIFQSLGEEHQKNVVRWALANRARVSEEARVALNGALIRNISVRGFRESNVPDAPAIMLIQPVQSAALLVDEIAQTVLAVWRESRMELRGIVEAAGSDGSAPGESLSEALASAHPQYSADDVNLMITLVMGERSVSVMEEETQDEEMREEESTTDAQRIFDDFFAELRSLPASYPEWDGPLTQLMEEIAELKANKTREMEEANGPGGRIGEVVGAHTDLLAFFEWNADERLPNATGPWGNTDFVIYAIERVADVLDRYETARETGTTYSEEMRRAAEREELQEKVVEALAALEKSTAMPMPEPAIEEVVPAEDESDESVEDGFEHETFEIAEIAETSEMDEKTEMAEKAETTEKTQMTETGDEADEVERQYLREMVEALQKENAGLKADKESAHQENAELKATAETAYQEDAESNVMAETARQVIDELPIAAETLHLGDVEAQKTEETLATPPDFGDVASVLDFVENRWPNELRLALNNNSDHKLYFDQPNQVYNALEWLATTYRNSKTGEKPVSNLDVSLFTRCGWRYRPFQADTAPGKYRSDYQTTDAGNKYVLDEHIGRGTGRTPGQIRVAFAWDEERKMVVVGYIGRHQRPNAT